MGSIGSVFWNAEQRRLRAFWRLLIWALVWVLLTWNFFQGNVFGFPVSGTPANVTTFIAIEQGGPDLWTDGAFGPEAGLIGIIAMAIGLALTLLWVHWRYGQIGLHLALAEAPTPATQNTQDVGPVNAPG